MMKERYLKEIKTTKMAKAKENVLNVGIQITSSESFQNYQEATIKELLLEDHGVIATKMKKKRLKTKNCLMAKLLNEVTNMPRATVGDTSLTRSYIPKVSQTPGIAPSIAHFYKPIENQCIHEGRVVDQLYYTSDHIDRCFSNIRLNCLYEINEPIVPRFVLDFYSQVTVQRDASGVILISCMIQNEFITLSLQQFGQILRILFVGQAVFTNKWDLGSLTYSQETEGPCHTDLPTPEEIHQFLQFQPEQQYNLAYFFVKRIKSARATPKARLPYEARRPRSDRGKARHSVSSASTHHNRGSSSQQGDDDEDDGASRASTPSLTTYLNSLRPLDYQQYYVPIYSEQNDDLLFER
ncbi:hypothetical protein Tco_1420582 [Tanacetum coccineum]